MLQVFISFALFASTFGESPAIQLVLTDKGLQYVRHFGAGLIQEKLDFVTFPDVSGNVIGIHYTLSGFKITKCDFPEPSVHFSPSVSGLEMSLSGLSVAISGNWATSFGIITDGGTFDLAVLNLDLTSVLELSRDSSGRLSVSSVRCDANIQSVDIEFHGGASWIFDPFVQFFTDKIKWRIQHHICPAVEETITKLENHLRVMNVSFDINSVIGLDLPLSVSPAVDDESMNFGLKGEFYSVETQEDPPFEPEPFTLPGQPNFMLSVGLSEYSVNSASFAYYISGHLQALINDSMIPPFVPLHLNTSQMGPYVPQLPQLFPNLLMTLQVYAREVPLFSFDPDSVKLDMLSSIKAFAVQTNSTLTPLFKLNVDSDFSGKMQIDGGKLKGSITVDNVTLFLASSEVGPFETDALENLAKSGMKIAMGIINKKLAAGYDIPQIKNAQLVNPVLKVEKGFIALASDAKLQSTY